MINLLVYEEVVHMDKNFITEEYSYRIFSYASSDFISIGKVSRQSTIKKHLTLESSKSYGARIKCGDNT